MRTKVFIQNLKCGGCAKTIELALGTIEGIEISEINTEENYVEFIQKQNDLQLTVLKTLKSLGYPSVEEENNFGRKAKSVLSCIRGRLDN